MVRMGKRESMHPSVQGFHMDHLAEKYSAQGVASLAEAVGKPGCFCHGVLIMQQHVVLHDLATSSDMPAAVCVGPLICAVAVPPCQHNKGAAWHWAGEQEQKRRRVQDLQAELAEVKEQVQEAERAEQADNAEKGKEEGADRPPSAPSKPSATLSALRDKRRKLYQRLDQSRDEVRQGSLAMSTTALHCTGSGSTSSI